MLDHMLMKTARRFAVVVALVAIVALAGCSCSEYEEQIKARFETTRRRLDLAPRGTELSTAAFRRPSGDQLGLF